MNVVEYLNNLFLPIYSEAELMRYFREHGEAKAPDRFAAGGLKHFYVAALRDAGIVSDRRYARLVSDGPLRKIPPKLVTQVLDNFEEGDDLVSTTLEHQLSNLTLGVASSSSRP